MERSTFEQPKSTTSTDFSRPSTSLVRFVVSFFRQSACREQDPCPARGTGRLVRSNQNRNQNRELGLVSAIAAPLRLKVTFVGQRDHSGATPMGLRQDALVGACEAVCLLEAKAKELRSELVATAGILNVPDASANVVPGEASLVLDIRDINALRRNQFAADRIRGFEAITRRRGLKLAVSEIMNGEPVHLSPELVAIESTAASKVGATFMEMVSGAGHDAMHFAPHVPTGLIFVPSRDGRSHCPEEYSDTDAIVKGAACLLETVLELDQSEVK